MGYLSTKESLPLQERSRSQFPPLEKKKLSEGRGDVAENPSSPKTFTPFPDPAGSEKLPDRAYVRLKKRITPFSVASAKNPFQKKKKKGTYVSHM